MERAPSLVNLDLEDLPVERTLGMQWTMETDDLNFRITDEGKAPARTWILSVVSSMYDPPRIRRAHHSASQEPAGEVMQAKVWLGRREFSWRFHRIARMAEGTCMFENDICSQMFQATRIRCSRQRPVTSFLGCIRRWLWSSIVPPDCRRQRCPA